MAERRSLFFDESGFTGVDLLHKSQPVFVLATHDFSEEECRAIREKYFRGVQARELKHETLKKYPRQQQMVRSFLEDLVTSFRGRVRCGVVHKRYALLGKVVDHLIHSAMEEDGIDLYEMGGNIALTNLLYAVLPAFMGDGGAFLDRVLDSFQRMVRERTREAYDAFFRPLFMQGVYPPQVEHLLVGICAAHLKIGPPVLDSIGPRALDVSLTSALSISARWRKTYPLPADLEVVHDTSSQMAKDRAIWDALTDPAVPPFVTGYDRRVMAYPVAIAATTFVNSRDVLGIQVADVVAGAVARAMESLCEGGRADEYSVALRQALAVDPSIVTDFVWPHDAITPAELGTDGPKFGDILLDTAFVARRARRPH